MINSIDVKVMQDDFSIWKYTFFVCFCGLKGLVIIKKNIEEKKGNKFSVSLCVCVLQSRLILMPSTLHINQKGWQSLHLSQLLDYDKL